MFNAPIRGIPIKYCQTAWYGNTRTVWLPVGKKSLMLSLGVSAEYWREVNGLDNVNYCKDHKNCQKQRKTIILINITRRALSRAHVPPTKVFPQLAVNKTILKPRLAAVTGALTYMWDFPDVIKFRFAAHTILEKAIRFRHPDYIIRIGLKS